MCTMVRTMVRALGTSACALNVLSGRNRIQNHAIGSYVGDR